MAFKIAELNTRYSAFIKGYFDRGFVISPFITGNNGWPINLAFFQKGLTFFDLINPEEKNTIYRMWIKNICDSDTHCDTPNESLKIEVRQYDRKIFRNTLWPEDGNLVDEKTFFFVSKTDVDSLYTDNESEIELINKRRFDRGVLHDSLKRLAAENKRRSLGIEKLSANFIDSIMARINNKPGFKHATATCINTVLLYKESYYYDRKRRKKLVSKLKAQVLFSYNSKTGRICLS